MTKCYKMVTIEALLEAGALADGLSVAEIAKRSHAILVRSPELFRDLEGVKELPDPRTPDMRRFTAYWSTNPIAAWTSGRSRRWFALDGDRFVPSLPCPSGDEETFIAMTRELTDYQLARYRDRGKEDASGASFS